MSDVTNKIAKPQMRGLLHSQIKKNLFMAGIAVVVSGLYMRYGFGASNKRDYAEFYKTYDIEKEFETMRKKGLFDSCDPE